MRKWMWMFVNGCECKGQIFNRTESLNGANVSKFSEILMRNNDTSVE
jgi:hypothetical protein